MNQIQEGYHCKTCNKFHKYELYVYAHSLNQLIHACDNCGAKHSIIRMIARQTEKGRLTKHNRQFVASTIETAK